MPQRTLTIYTDGGARGNPGPSAYGFVVYENEKIVYEESGFLGVSTNNRAEYQGVLHAMEWLTRQREDVLSVHFILDSELVVRQLNGSYKIKDQALKILALRVVELQQSLLMEFRYSTVKRALNAYADMLVNKSLDENTTLSRPD